MDSGQRPGILGNWNLTKKCFMNICQNTIHDIKLTYIHNTHAQHIYNILDRTLEGESDALFCCICLAHMGAIFARTVSHGWKSKYETRQDDPRLHTQIQSQWSFFSFDFWWEWHDMRESWKVWSVVRNLCIFLLKCIYIHMYVFTLSWKKKKCT